MNKSEGSRAVAVSTGDSPAPRTRSARRASTGRHLLGCRRATEVPTPAPAAEHETDREAELRALMIMAAHDLKSPLTVAAARVDMLRDDYADTLGEDFGRDLAAMERAVRRMARLTQDLLDYARTGHTLDPAPVSLREMAEDVIAEHTTAPNPPEITVVGALPDVLADRNLLRHVLDNLVGNAVKYTRPGETPRIELSARPQSDGTLRVEVTDAGIGIPAADRSQVFDAFHRCANSGAYPGTGLGLAICKRIIERHGGRIGVEESPALGSRFWFTVPVPPRG